MERNDMVWHGMAWHTNLETQISSTRVALSCINAREHLCTQL